MRLRLVILGLILCVGMLTVAGCNRSAGEQVTAFPPTPVTVAPAVAREVPIYLDEIGKCTARESVTITPEVAGLITERHFEDGAELKKGQLLFVIDPRPFQAQLHSAKAQLAQCKAALDYANIQLKRYADVADTRAISQSDYDTKKNAVETAEAQMSAADAAIETATVNLDYCQIHSPIDGRAGARLVDVGNVVKANEGALLSIQRLDPIYADFTITEHNLPEVQKQMAQGVLKTLVRLPTDSESQARTGNLIFLDNAVQDGSGTVKLRAELPNADHHLWPGQFVNVRLVLLVKPSVLVPTIATQISQQGLFVFKVVPDAKSPTKLAAMQQPVKLGQRHGEQVVIENGISAGDRVVTSGQMLLQPGSPLMIVNNDSVPPASPGAAAAPKVGPGSPDSPNDEQAAKPGPAASANPQSEGGRS